jgi:hypothetical protein
MLSFVTSQSIFSSRCDTVLQRRLRASAVIRRLNQAKNAIEDQTLVIHVVTHRASYSRMQFAGEKPLTNFVFLG